MKSTRFIYFTLLLLLLQGCGVNKLKTFEFPQPEDTNDKPIQTQVKTTYAVNDVFASNEFDGARLNNFEFVNDSTYAATILPENEPINSSPHYAFRIWSKKSETVYIQLRYPTSKHRYWPKLSEDGKHWQPIDSTDFILLNDGKNAQLRVVVNQEPLWIAAQELNNSTAAKEWATAMLTDPRVRMGLAGKSKLGRDLLVLDIYEGAPNDKDVIVILSRQHPPEVTGYLAMQAFVKELLQDNKLATDFLKKYRILVFPMMNPDGVDLGHWRHNAGGIDLNRDWAFYRQPEVNQVVNYIVNTANRDENKVILGLDFHSTQEDLYYTIADEHHSVLYPFKDYWLQSIDFALLGYTPDDHPDPFGQPVTKAWFYKQFQADAVIYEIGDETPRDFIKTKAETAAREMMKLLILR
jgi:murein tripeptide amidase MpaA